MRRRLPIEWEAALCVSISKVVDALYDKEWREIPPFGINTFDCCRLFPIARLYEFTSSTSIGTRNHHRGIELSPKYLQLSLGLANRSLGLGDRRPLTTVGRRTTSTIVVIELKGKSPYALEVQ